MRWVFVESSNFTSVVPDYFPEDDDYHRLQVFLSLDPLAGNVIPGCGGLRKLRWPDPRRRKGKKGGLRIIYLQVPEASRIYFLDLYDKNEAEDITPKVRRLLAQLARGLRDECLELRTKGPRS